MGPIPPAKRVAISAEHIWTAVSRWPSWPAIGGMVAGDGEAGRGRADALSERAGVGVEEGGPRRGGGGADGRVRLWRQRRGAAERRRRGLRHRRADGASHGRGPGLRDSCRRWCRPWTRATTPASCRRWCLLTTRARPTRALRPVTRARMRGWCRRCPLRSTPGSCRRCLRRCRLRRCRLRRCRLRRRRRRASRCPSDPWPSGARQRPPRARPCSRHSGGAGPRTISSAARRPRR